MTSCLCPPRAHTAHHLNGLVFAAKESLVVEGATRPDGREVSRACVENCPTDTIVNNFRCGVGSCPTCLTIKGASTIAELTTCPPGARRDD